MNKPIGFISSDETTTGYRYTYDGLGRRVAKGTIRHHHRRHQRTSHTNPLRHTHLDWSPHQPTTIRRPILGCRIRLTYNRFRYYNPVLGAYNTQDPLELAPRVASAQGYVDHAAYWVNVFGLMAHKVLSAKDQSRVSFIHNRVNAHKQAVIDDWNAGRISLSERQMAHCRAEGWPKAMHRGTAMDQALKQRIENDKILTKLEVSVAHQGEAGADVIYTLPDSGTQIWMDMTTEKAWANHYSKYGSVEGVPESMHKATYQSDGYSRFMDFRGRVK